MARFKNGQIIKLRRNVTFTYPKGCLLEVGHISGNDVELNTVLQTKTFNIVERESMKSSKNYIDSNRNKLREHIKSLGFTAIDLSVAAGFNKYYFGSETGEARFNKRGDISDKRLSELKALASIAKTKLSSKSIGKLTIDLEVKTTFVSDQSKESIEKLPENKPEKLKSKWIVSNKVFFTFLFFFLLLILFIVTGVVKQVF